MSDAKIIRMANQIARFFHSQREPTRAQGVAGHINDFWEPRMRAELFDIVARGGAGLNPLVLDAMPYVRPPAPTD